MRRRRRICRIGRTGIRCLALHSRRVSPCGRHCRHLVNGGVAANCSVFADELRAAVSRIDHAMPAQNMVYQNRVYSTKGVSSHLEPRCAAPTEQHSVSFCPLLHSAVWQPLFGLSASCQAPAGAPTLSWNCAWTAVGTGEFNSLLPQCGPCLRPPFDLPAESTAVVPLSAPTQPTWTTSTTALLASAGATSSMPAR